eukprot:6089556-Pyramimonas_sp.AAC.1
MNVDVLMTETQVPIAYASVGGPTTFVALVVRANLPAAPHGRLCRTGPAASIVAMLNHYRLESHRFARAPSYPEAHALNEASRTALRLPLRGAQRQLLARGVLHHSMLTDRHHLPHPRPTDH